MSNKIPKDDKSAAEYIVNWIKAIKDEKRHNPEASIEKEPGLYIGGLKCMPGDTIITDNHGLPQIIRAGCCE